MSIVVVCGRGKNLLLPRFPDAFLVCGISLFVHLCTGLMEPSGALFLHPTHYFTTLYCSYFFNYCFTCREFSAGYVYRILFRSHAVLMNETEMYSSL